MTRVHSLTSALSIWVYADHMPPHFHVRSPKTNCLVEIRTLQVIRGKYDRKDYAAVVAWASDDANMALIETTWRKLNERD